MKYGIRSVKGCTMSLPTLSRGGLEGILSGMDRGGLANHHLRDNLAGLSYTSCFDASQLGRSGGSVINYGSDRDHYDVIERLNSGDFLHHRIYKP
jgi:hypothetical protein